MIDGNHSLPPTFSVPGPRVAGPAVPARRHPLQLAGRAGVHPGHQLLAGHQSRPAHVHLHLHREFISITNVGFTGRPIFSKLKVVLLGLLLHSA